MKTNISAFLILLLAVFNLNTAQAQSPRLKSPLTVTDLGKTVRVCYDISGLGNVSSVDLILNYRADVTTQCSNPAGNVAPGQSGSFSDNPEQVTVPVHNGRAIGCVTSTKVFPAGDGPNSKWDCEVTDVAFSNISISVLGKTFRYNP